MDILIRGLSEETVAAIDHLAARAGLSRQQWLRRTLEAQVDIVHVTGDDFQVIADLAEDLADEGVMKAAWS